MTISGPSASPSTEKAEHPDASRLSSVALKWDDELDGPIPAEHFVPREWRWDWPMWIRPKQRLLKSQAVEVQAYINQIVRQSYPYQVREYMGRHLWVEFCEYYAINPDINRAMRYL